MGESRQELLTWLNSLLQLNLTKVEQCGTGAAICQIFDSIFMDLPMSRVKFNGKTEYDFLQNFKILTTTFAVHGIDRPIPVERLVKCKMQDNLEFLQWSKRFWDQHYPGGEYDALARRRGQGMANASGPAPRTAAVSSTAKGRGATPVVSSARTRTPLGGGASTSALQQEIATLKEDVEGVKRERDFYFNKLRDIEILLQDTAEDEQEDKDVIIKNIQAVLYSTEEGFEIPEEGTEGEAVEDETF